MAFKNLVVTIISVVLSGVIVLGFCESEAKTELLHLNADEIAQLVLNTTGTGGWTPGIGDWEPPGNLSNDFRYFVGGYDYFKRPVVFWEAGKWPSRKYLENATTRGDMYLYMEQLWFRLQHLKSPYDEAEEGIMLIVDMSDFKAQELASIETMRFHLYGMRLGEKFEGHVEEFWMINTHFAGQTWINVMRSVSGNLMGKSQVFATKEIWLPLLASKMDKDQIPSWYDEGNVDYKPVKVWG